MKRRSCRAAFLAVAAIAVLSSCGGEASVVAEPTTATGSQPAATATAAPAAVSPPTPTAVPTPTPVPATADPLPTSTPQPAAAETPAEAASPCRALIPRYPDPDATGVVAFDLSGDWAIYNYAALYVIDPNGESAMVAGKPAVRNRDSFAFVVDASMYADPAKNVVLVSMNDDQTVACTVELSDLPTIDAESGGAAGY